MQISPKVSKITRNIIQRFLPAIFGIAGNQFLPAKCRQVPCLETGVIEGPEINMKMSLRDETLSYFFSFLTFLLHPGLSNWNKKQHFFLWKTRKLQHIFAFDYLLAVGWLHHFSNKNSNQNTNLRLQYGQYGIRVVLSVFIIIFVQVPIHEG